MSLFERLNDFTRSFWKWGGVDVAADMGTVTLNDDTEPEPVEGYCHTDVFPVDTKEADEILNRWDDFEKEHIENRRKMIEEYIAGGYVAESSLFAVGHHREYIYEINKFNDDDSIQEVLYGRSWGRQHYYFRSMNGKLYSCAIKNGCMQECVEVTHFSSNMDDDNYELSEFKLGPGSGKIMDDDEDSISISSLPDLIQCDSASDDDNKSDVDMETDTGSVTINRVPSWVLMDIRDNTDESQPEYYCQDGELIEPDSLKVDEVDVVCDLFD